MSKFDVYATFNNTVHESKFIIKMEISMECKNCSNVFYANLANHFLLCSNVVTSQLK